MYIYLPIPKQVTAPCSAEYHEKCWQQERAGVTHVLIYWLLQFFLSVQLTTVLHTHAHTDGEPQLGQTRATLLAKEEAALLLTCRLSAHMLAMSLSVYQGLTCCPDCFRPIAEDNTFGSYPCQKAECWYSVGTKVIPSRLWFAISSFQVTLDDFFYVRIL